MTTLGGGMVMITSDGGKLTIRLLLSMIDKTGSLLRSTTGCTESSSSSLTSAVPPLNKDDDNDNTISIATYLDFFLEDMRGPMPWLSFHPIVASSFLPMLFDEEEETA
jgi:hypothetical protein